jgi:hypothetical protein
MKDYASMSDFGVNCHVAMALGMKEHFFMGAGDEDDFDDEIPLTERGPIWQTCKYRVGAYKPSNGNCFNPCNNPADAWPIITENRIGIIPAPDAGKWKSAHREVGEDDTPYHFTQSDNPLRAAMIVFLVMKEGE